MKQVLIFIGCSILFSAKNFAQNYHAIQGSSYAGALGVHNNPASIVNTPFSWDIALFGAQLTNSTNAFVIHDYSLLSSPANSKYSFREGEYSRFDKLNFNLNLFNTRIALNRKHSIAFGVNLRSHSNIETGNYNFIDTIKTTGDFFLLNENNTVLNEKLVSSSWLEGFLTYSRTIYDNETGRLNAGVTVRVSRGISGAFANLNSGQFSKAIINNKPFYTVDNASLVYGYSHNYDQWTKGNSTSQNLKNFVFGFTEGGASLDAGIEYLVKPQGTLSFNDDAEDYYDYDWKFGLSLLDIGFNQYKYGKESRSINAVKTNITNLILDKKFDSTINSFKKLNDSLSTIVDQNNLGGVFKIANPMRLVINIDRYFYSNFYINAEISLNFPSSFLKKYIRVKEVNLITVTPRWETKKLGAYLPIQFNNQNQFWIGAAFKAGPLLIGVHNLANVFSKSSMQNGGGYIALIFRAPKELQGKRDKKLDCPPAIW
jgi:hypothetical protein